MRVPARNTFAIPVCGPIRSSSRDEGAVHPNARNLTGRRFGKVSVRWAMNVRWNGSVVWFCRCDCGNPFLVRATALTRKHGVRSCGCVQYQKLPAGESDFRALFLDYKRSAAKRGYGFYLTVEEAKKLFKQNCHYCGALPSQKLNQGPRGRHGVFIYNGIDRTNNLLGYVKRNCVACCKICNRAKSIMRYADWLSWLKRIAQHQREKHA